MELEDDVQISYPETEVELSIHSSDEEVEEDEEEVPDCDDPRQSNDSSFQEEDVDDRESHVAAEVWFSTICGSLSKVFHLICLSNLFI